MAAMSLQLRAAIATSTTAMTSTAEICVLSVVTDLQTHRHMELGAERMPASWFHRQVVSRKAIKAIYAI
jgi:hypothetical protein